MNNKERLQDAIGSIDDDLIAEAKSVKKRTPLIKILPIAASFALAITAIPIIFLIANREDRKSLPPDKNIDDMICGSEDIVDNNKESSEQTGNTGTNAESSTNSDVISEYWTDLRSYNSFIEYKQEEKGYIWSWEFFEEHEKYRSVILNETEFISTLCSISENRIGDELGEAIAQGYDTIEYKQYETECRAYKIKGINADNIIAVKLEGEEDYWVYKFIHGDFPTSPPNLGELINKYDLAKNLILTKFSNSTDILTHYLSEPSSNHIWSLLANSADAESSVDGYSPRPDMGKEYISFTAKSDILGLKNKSFRIYKSGYLTTNIEEYGLIFFIGEDIANEIIAYALENSSESEPQTYSYVVGHITESGDDYFKINDAAMMQNETDGIEFTVMTQDIKILRYFKAGILQEGSLVILEYDGKIKNDGNFIINGATGIDECFIVNGDALIPE